MTCRPYKGNMEFCFGIYAQGYLQHLVLWNHLEKLALIFLYNLKSHNVIL